MITVKQFGKTDDGREVLMFTLSDGPRSATVLNLGGTLQSIVVPDKNGNPTDVLLGYADAAGYQHTGGYLGALIGRFGNRIEKGRLKIDGKEYQLFCNDRGNHLHGGKEGFDKKIWAHEIKGEELILTYTSPDGEENYPGTLKVTVVYSFVGGELKICYHAVSDKKTAVSLTNHAYFNMNGENGGSSEDNVLWIDSDEITPTDDTLIPHGEFKKVAGTPFDFNVPKEIGKDVEADDPDLKRGGGYDHCYVLKTAGKLAKYASVESKKTGIKMTCYTDAPAVQFYAGNGLNAQGKTGHYGKRGGFCLETQAIPNNVNVPAYAALGSSIIEAGQVYSYTAIYKFEA